MPIIYVQSHPEIYPNAPIAAIDYTISHFTGIFLTSTTVLVAYLIFTKNRPQLDRRILLPSFATGLMWALAQLGWLVSNDLLSQVISFPINAMVPGVVATLWSVFVFHEIVGGKNYKFLAVAVTITLCGAILVGLSKDL